MTGETHVTAQPSSIEGDPQKCAYLHNPNWTPNPMADLRGVQPMPGTCLKCLFNQGEHLETCVTMAVPDL